MTATIMLALFAIDPFNFVSPVIGVIDDFVLLPLLLRWLVRAATLSGAYGRSSAAIQPTALLSSQRS